MAVKTSYISLKTRGYCDIVDITSQLGDVVASSGITYGIVTLFVPGSTGGITTVEYESGLLSDLKSAFERLFPQGIEYAHDARWHDGNGFSHVRASFLKASLTIPIVDGELTLGTWQQVVFIDFDNRRRNRRIVVQVMGE